MLDQYATIAGLSQLHFRHFVKFFWNCVCQDDFKPAYFVDVICEHLQAVKDGQIKRLAVACPIKHGKSTLTQILFPAYLWVHDPSLRMLTVSHGENLAIDFCAQTRDLIAHPLYQNCFGQRYQITDEQNAKSFYRTSHLGYRRALGTHSNTSGTTADIILSDDILDYKKAKSELERQSVKDYWTGTLTQRIAEGNGKDRILLIGHRVHEDDVFNLVWETYGNDGTWTYLVLPAEAQPYVTNSYYNGIGWKDTRLEGELLNESRYPKEVLDERKKNLRHEYHCLFNQDPSPASGDLFKPEWFRYYTEVMDEEEAYNLDGRLVKKSKAIRFMTVDTAVTTEAHSDYTVCQVWDIIHQDMVLVHQTRQKLDGHLLVGTVESVVNLYRPEFVVCEKEFVGQFVIDQLRAKDIFVRPFRAKGHGDKLARAVAAEIRLEAGRIWFPTNKPFVADLEREILSFPNGLHDDQVDCLAMAAIQCDRYMGKAERELTEEEKQEKAQKEAQDLFQAMLFADCPF